MADLASYLRAALHAAETEGILREELPKVAAGLMEPVRPDEAGLAPHQVLLLRLGFAYANVSEKAGTPFRSLINSVETIVGDENPPKKPA